MAMVKKVGELDYRFQPDEITPNPALIYSLRRAYREEFQLLEEVLAQPSPIITDHRLVKKLNFSLQLDENFHRAKDEKAGYSQKDGWHRHLELDNKTISLPEDKLMLPKEIRILLRRSYDFLGASTLIYNWDGKEDLQLFFFFEPPSIEIKKPDRFLHKLARKMSKWYKEACQTT